MRHSIAILGIIAGLLAAGATPSQAGIIVGYTPGSAASHNTYDRFLGPYPAAPVTNTTGQFILNGFTSTPGIGTNLSGIGWSTQNSTFSLTLVSPQHVIGNWHVFSSGLFQPGTSVQFLNRNGELKTYNLSSAQPFRPTTTFINSMGQPQTLPSDVYLGTLASPIPASDLVDFFPVVNGPTAQFINVPINVYGQNNPGQFTPPAYINPQTGTASPHFGRNNIDAIGLASFDGNPPVNEATIAYIYDFNNSIPGEIHVIGGDSGSPSLINLGSQLGLVGTHYGLDTQTLTSVDTFLPFYINQLDAAMRSNTAFGLTIVPVPEPATLILVGLAAGFGWRRRRAQ